MIRSGLVGGDFLESGKMNIEVYDHIRSGGAGFVEKPRGLIAVWGKEAVPFLDGMITNDMKTLADSEQMLAAFPNAQGRLLAVVRILRQGERFLIETESVTREKVFNNLFRFTFAGDFFVEDISENYVFYDAWNLGGPAPFPVLQFDGEGPVTLAAANESVEDVSRWMTDAGFVEVSDELYETLRIEAGVAKFGVDMDETTIVPELGLERMISYTKGCYIGQEIIARIHFRGHVAKQLAGLVSEPDADDEGLVPGADLATGDGKNAGRVTSVTYSPKLQQKIALAFVRYDHLAAGTRLVAGTSPVLVSKLPFIS